VFEVNHVLNRRRYKDQGRMFIHHLYIKEYSW